MLCPKCRTPNSDDSLFCEYCGAMLELSCPACGAPINRSARFCRKCGTQIAAATFSAPVPVIPVEVTQSGAEIPDGERKTITALFADLKGSTELMESLDPEEARAIIDPALKRMIEAVHRYDGYIVQSTGDGIFALFGAPAAYEDHPQRALHAALRLQDGLRAYSAKLVADGGTPLEAAWVSIPVR